MTILQGNECLGAGGGSKNEIEGKDKKKQEETWQVALVLSQVLDCAGPDKMASETPLASSLHDMM